ncbi:nickel-dependent hydrogenase large subunit [Candidatus Gottesmanbacteria bacterium]|nr:nickel-dependent hydrogenase large subunit [Candidatus Gottesmanbacteria bacterium]
MHDFDLNIGELSKIEGKASLTVKVENEEVKECRFKIDEFKRFYTQAIRGKDVLALPQLTSRICGTCSNAHLLCAIKAVEDALQIKPSEQTEILRKLLNFGLIIRDHALHLYIFVMPDILRVDSILELDENNSQEHQILDDAFAVKSAGNNLSKVMGGRSVHAPFPAVGGFTKLPDQKLFHSLVKELENIRPAVLRLIKIFQECDFHLERDTDYVALIDEELSFLKGCIIKNEETIACQNYGIYLDKVVIPYSHAVGYKFMDRIHMTGALARLNLASDKLNIRTKEDAKEALKLFPSRNIFHNNLAQAIEILHTVDRSVEILSSLSIKDEKPVPIVRKAGIGMGVTEAPRGTLYYKLSIDEEGKVINGDIVVPTGQNQVGIERSIYEYIKANLNKNKDELTNEI